MWILLILIIIVYLIIRGIGSLLNSSETTRMQKEFASFDPYGYHENVGKSVIGYDTKEEEVSYELVPATLRAKKVRDVGYVVFYSSGESVSRYMDGSTVSVESLSVQVVSYKDGEVIGSQTFRGKAAPGSITKESGTKSIHRKNSVDRDSVRSWVMEVVTTKGVK